MVAKGGDRLLDRDAEQAYVERLFPLATVLTPNLSEAEALLLRPVRTLDDMKAAARELHRRGVRAVVSRAATCRATRSTSSSTGPGSRS